MCVDALFTLFPNNGGVFEISQKMGYIILSCRTVSSLHVGLEILKTIEDRPVRNSFILLT